MCSHGKLHNLCHLKQYNVGLHLLSVEARVRIDYRSRITEYHLLSDRSFRVCTFVNCMEVGGN